VLERGRPSRCTFLASATSASYAMRAPVESPISMRSCLSVARVTFQPSPRRPTMLIPMKTPGIDVRPLV